MGCGTLRSPPCWDAGGVGVPRSAAAPSNKRGRWRGCRRCPPGHARDELGVGETEAGSGAASCCAGNVPLPPPSPLQRGRRQERTGRAITGSVIRPQQGQEPAPRRGGRAGARERRRERTTPPALNPAITSHSGCISHLESADTKM